MRKTIAIVVAAALAAALGGCSKNSAIGCSDYIAQICNKFDECGVLDQAGLTQGECAANLRVNIFSANDTEECKEIWDQVNAAPCGVYR